MPKAILHIVLCIFLLLHLTDGKIQRINRNNRTNALLHILRDGLDDYYDYYDYALPNGCQLVQNQMLFYILTSMTSLFSRVNIR